MTKSQGKHKVRKRTSYADPKDYIYDHVTVTESGCWEWAGSLRRGYPTVGIKGQSFRLNRYSYELFIGPIPDGVSVLHQCDNALCVNPEHLFLGTQLDNMKDMLRKGRHPRTKFSPAQVLDLIDRIKNGATRKGLARELGVHVHTIQAILKGVTWKWVTGDVERPGPGRTAKSLTLEEVVEIRTLLDKIPTTQIALKFGVSRRCIYDIRKGKTWRGVE